MLRFSLIKLLLALASVIVSTHADAVQRAFVSAKVGLDTNTSFNCDAARPCRGFQAALTVVDPNGEVVVLDSGGYGVVTIAQSVSLIAPKGVYAGITAFAGTNGVTIATSGIAVVLRGITINSLGGENGILMTGAARLSVEDCFISDFTDASARAGIRVSSTGNSFVTVTDSNLRRNAAGIALAGKTTATISRTTLVGPGGFGIDASNNVVNSQTIVAVFDSSVSLTGTGIIASTSVTNASVLVSISNNKIVNNSFGIAVTSNPSGGAIAPTVQSLGNNTIRLNNNVDVAGTITTVTPL
jgi:hypothetical protein